MKCITLFLVLSMVVLMAEPGECLFDLHFGKGAHLGNHGGIFQGHNNKGGSMCEDKQDKQDKEDKEDKQDKQDEQDKGDELWNYFNRDYSEYYNLDQTRSD